MFPRPIIDDCHKIHLRQLWKSGLIHPGHHSGVLALVSSGGGGNIQFHTCLSVDEGCWIELGGWGRWELAIQPIGNFSDDCPSRKRPGWGAWWFAVGKDGRRVKCLLVTPDLKAAGTRFELGAVWRCQWTKSYKRRISSRARIMRQLQTHARPDDLSLIFSPYQKPKGQYLVTYLDQREREGAKDILVKRPKRMRTRTCHRLLNRLNRTRGKSPSPPSKPLVIYPTPKYRESAETEALLRKLAAHRSG